MGRAKVLAALDAALAAVPGAQQRAGQRVMVEAVAAALAPAGEHLLVQAGTGTGKSLAYLVPALMSGRRVVVATATKALQAQLVDKDLPALVEALEPVLGRRATFALAKGRSNYLCLLQAHGGPGARDEEPVGLFDTAASSLGSQVVRLREWAGDSETGDRDEVPFPVSDRAWRQVSVSARECLGGRCPDRFDCFAEQARESARDADVVVTNHALLALKVFTDVQVLPERDAVIVDEAHELVAAVTAALTRELALADLRQAVRGAGELVRPATVQRLQDAVDGTEGVLATTGPGWLRRLPEGAAAALGLLEAVATAAAAEVTTGLPAGEGADDGDAARRERARSALTELAAAAHELREPAVPSAVYAVSDGAAVRLRVSPLAVDSALSDRLFGRTRVVATSATLTLAGSFRPSAQALGLSWPAGRPAGGGGPRDRSEVDVAGEALAGEALAGEALAGATDGALAGEPEPPRWRYLDVGSPFEPARQGQLWVPRDLPDPGREPVAWAAAVDQLLVELVSAAGGRTLGLFSSTAAAARAAEHVRAALDVPVLLQGDDTAGALQHRFAAEARTCLLGTRSFWQGVDTPGSACQLVVVDRIPFGHVDDPLAQARLAAAADAGRNGFLEVTLPPAAVLLAQGVGRLLRSTSDRGVVAVLDPRLVSARYGALLLATLPGFYLARSKSAVLASLRAIDAGAPPVLPVGVPPAERRRTRAAADR